MSESSIEESINLGAMGEALNDKMDRDAQNAEISVTQTSGADLVVEWKAPTDSDPTWYRLYASGWLVQGGLTAAQPGSSIQITFPKAYNTSNYFLTVNSRSNEADTGGYGDVKVGINGNGTYEFGQATTGFRCSTINESVTKFSWRAEGMRAK